MKVGMVLVLFILLVIGTNVFGRVNNSDDTDSSVGITGTQNFYIENRTTNYRLRFSSRSGPANLPEVLSLPPGTGTRYVVRTSEFSPVYVTTVYNIYDLSGNNVGYFTFWIEGSDFFAFAYFQGGKGSNYPRDRIGLEIQSSKTIVCYEL